MSDPLLRVSELVTEFPTSRGPLVAVDGVSFELGAGETLGIVGESGSGKSVLVRTIMGLLPAHATTSGRVEFDGVDLHSASLARSRRLWGTEIAMVFQDPTTSLNPVKKIGTHLTESLRRHLGLSRRAAADRAVDLLAQVGIPDPKRRVGQFPHELSGGMRQRVAIAIALACEPRLLVADEPTTALDVTVQRQILDLLSALQAEWSMAMILITHDLGVVAGRTDRVAVMYAGRLVETAATDQLFGAIRHPYTEALVGSMPRIDQPSHTRLVAIGGRPPDPAARPPGCSFAPRCRQAGADCVTDDPTLRPLDVGTVEMSGGPAGADHDARARTDHRVACHHPVRADDVNLERRARRRLVTVAAPAGGPPR